jgi:GTP-binding protein
VPKVEEGPFRFLATTISADPFLGRILTGRIMSGSVKPNQTAKVLGRDGTLIEQGRVSKVLAFRGLERVPIDGAEAGDIVSLAGMTKANVADTFCAPEVTQPIEARPIDPPTISMSFRVNDSPLAGTEGTKVTSRVIWDRLVKEAEGNVALKIERRTDAEAFTVSGRGELQLAVLIETMRREGFELGVSRPQVVMQQDEKGDTLEPIEEVIIDVDDEHAGIVVSKLSERKAEMKDMRPSGTGRTRLIFHAPTRGLIGYQGELLSDTRGTAIMNRIFHAYEPHKGKITGRHTGVLISNDMGEAVAFALWNLEERGPMMIHPGTKVYEGMIVGEHTRDNDLEVNVLKGKKLTNMRASGSDEAVRLTPPLQMTLEKSLAYITDDELVEVTPKSIRLRKIHLDPNTRKRLAKAEAS